MKQILSVLWHYQAAKRLKFRSRTELDAHQQRALARHLEWLTRTSPYYREFAGRPLCDFPRVDKQHCLQHFNAMNTAGLSLDHVQNVALRAEDSRDFSPTVGRYTVGLSSGTSGTRGVFVVSPEERAKWAGLALARLLPDGLLRGERIAFFLRAGSNLYSTVRTPWISFRFFDLQAAFTPQLSELDAYQPSIIVAPAQVLREFALAQQAQRLHISPKRVISVAEVLEASDRQLLAEHLVAPAEVYQATEGFLGYTCPHGTLHLNEEYLHVEPEWLDADRTRMVPIITDFSRKTQPVIRYRLNDILAVRHDPCPCGNAALALSHIEGRCDDLLLLPSSQGRTIPVFADSLSRILLRVLPLDLDYRLSQTGAHRLHLTCPLDQTLHTHTIAELNRLLAELGVASSTLEWSIEPVAPRFDPNAKRRRITRQETP